MHSPITVLLLGLALIHGFGYYCALLGTSLMHNLDPDRSDPGYKNDAVELLISIAFGAAVVILGLFALGAVGLLAAGPIVAGLLSVLGVSFGMATRKGSAVNLRDMLIRPFLPFSRWPILAIYVASLVFIVPSLLPPTMFDSTMYHLAYARVWATDGKLSVDPYIRFPMFTYNFELLFAMFFALHVGRFVDLLTWMMFAITMIGIFALVDFVLVELGVPLKTATSGGLVAALAFFLCPTVLKFCDVGYIDIPVGAFFLASTSAIIFATRKFWPYGLAAGVIGASLIGMKLGLVLDIPLFVFLIIRAGRSTQASRNVIAWSIATFALFLAPWYLRSLYYTGDPLSPLLNGLLHRPDPFISQGDFAAATSGNPFFASRLAQVFLTPFQLFAQNDDNLDFAICFYPLLIIAIFYSLIRQRTNSMFLINILSGVALYGLLADSLTTAMISRYALHFYAVFLCAVFVLLFWSLQNICSRFGAFRRPILVCGIVLSLALTQSAPGSSSPLVDLGPELHSFGPSVHSPELYISQRVDGYHNAEDISDVLNASHLQANVLAVHFENLAYYFRSRHVVSIGDWTGPGRFSDLRTAIQTGSLKTYLSRLRIGAVMFLDLSPLPKDSPFLKNEIGEAEKAFTELGFVDYSVPGDPVKEYVLKSILDRAHALGYVSLTPRVSNAGYEIISHFDVDGIMPKSPASTPTGHGALVMRWPSNDGNIECLTVLSGFTYTRAAIPVKKKSQLLFSVAKVFAMGSPVIAYVDEIADGKTTRIFSGREQPADGDELRWTAEEVKVIPSRHDISLVFGVSSVPGGGMADWVAFERPLVTL